MGMNQIAVPVRYEPNRPEPRQKDTMDKILQGVQIAGGLLNIGVDVQKIRDYQGKIDANDDTQNGIISKQEQLEKGKGLEQVPAGTDGAQNFKVRTGNTGDDSKDFEQISLRTPSKPEPREPKGLTVPNATINGVSGTAYYADPSKMSPTDPSAGLTALTPTAKPDKTPNVQFVETKDANGNPIRKAVEVVPGATLPLPDKEKPGEDPAKVYERLTDKIQNFRGDKAAAQANQNMLSADNALGIVNRYARAGKSLDDMSNQDYATFMSELDKIAKGGTPTEGSLDRQTVSTLQSKVNNFLSKVDGKPAPAELGAFIRDNVDYLTELRGISQDVVDNHTRTAFNGVKRKLGDTYVGYFHEDNPDFFEREAQRANAKTSGQSTATAATIPTHRSDTSGTAVAAPSAGGVPQGGKYPPGTILDIGGQKVRVQADGKTALPLEVDQPADRPLDTGGRSR